MMNFLDLEKKLIHKELPGWEFQKIMAPPYRDVFTVEEILAKNPPIASVLITIYKKDNKFYFPLILRAEYEGTHSGQVGLPGGKKEIFDISTQETALRETEEEIGIGKEELKIVRKITPLYIPPSNFYVDSYIGFYEKEEVNFIPNPKEVQKVYEIDLFKFLNETNIFQIKNAKSEHLIPAFKYEDIIIWGATAMILNEFRALLKI